MRDSLTLDEVLADLSNSLAECSGDFVAEIVNKALTRKVKYCSKHDDYIIEMPLFAYVREFCETQFGLESQDNGSIDVSNDYIVIESKGSMKVDEVLEMCNEMLQELNSNRIKGYELPEYHVWEIVMITKQLARFELVSSNKVR